VRVRFLLVFLAVPFHAHAAVLGFDESFNGTGVYQTIDGNFDGLDVPGWEIEGDGQIDSGGYIVTNYDDDVIHFGESDSLSRVVFGQGSFTSRVEIRDVYLGDLGEGSPPDAFGRIHLRHLLGNGNEWLDISLKESEDSPDGQWGLFLSIKGKIAHSAFVPHTEDIAFSIHFDNTVSQATFVYDPDFNDEVPGDLFGPFSYTGEFLESTTTTLTFAARSLGHANGIVDHWSILPLSDVPGDFNGNGILDAADIDQLSEQVREATNDPLYDLNADALVNDLDRQVWVHDLKQTWFGDADLNGAFDSTDLVQVLAFGEYEDGVELSSTWLTGDWDGDAEFTSGDLVVALADGGYEAGAMAVPEPAEVVLTMAIAALAMTSRRPKTRRK
jgi:hypothetical protein